MGWLDYHLYKFNIAKKRYTEAPESKEDSLEAANYTLEKLIKKNGEIFSYLYDFGDGWGMSSRGCWRSLWV